MARHPSASRAACLWESLIGGAGSTLYLALGLLVSPEIDSKYLEAPIGVPVAAGLAVAGLVTAIAAREATGDAAPTALQRIRRGAVVAGGLAVGYLTYKFGLDVLPGPDPLLPIAGMVAASGAAAIAMHR